MIDEKKELQKEETVKQIRAIYPKIIVGMIYDIPYYSIRYFDLDDCSWHVGYSSYRIELVAEWLRTHFDVVEDFEWIPVSEQLPKNNGFYLATLDGAIVGEDRPFTGLAEFKDGKWIDDEEDYKCVIAWQPLPEPYSPEK